MPDSNAPSLFLGADAIYYNKAGRLYRICLSNNQSFFLIPMTTQYLAFVIRVLEKVRNKLLSPHSAVSRHVMPNVHV